MNSEWVEPPKDQGKTGLATPGAQLKAQREALGLSVEQIADQLKLAPRQVAALEAGDYAALPNMAVTRGFVRAYAKVVRIDAAPLVAMIEVRSPTSPEVSPPRKEIAATFSDTRQPLMKSRSSHTGAWIMGGVAVVVVVGGLFAYQSGLVAHAMSFFKQGADSAAVTTEPVKAGTTVAPLETTLVKPGQETTPLQSPNVPLVSVPPVVGGSAANAGAVAGVAPAAGTVAGTAPATAPVNTPAPTVAGQPATTAAAPAAAGAAAVAAPAAGAAPAAAAVTGTALVLKVTEDSWVEIRRPGAAPLVSRVIKAGSTETFDIKGPSLLVVGKPAGVQASLGGAPLALPQIAGGTIARVNIK